MRKKIIISFVSILSLYVVSYLTLSLACGYYHPWAYGGNKGGIKSYRWYPLGDYEVTKSGSMSITSIIYLPLTKFDMMWWHTSDKLWSMDYPVKVYYDASSDSFKSNLMSGE